MDQPALPAVPDPVEQPQPQPKARRSFRVSPHAIFKQYGILIPLILIAIVAFQVRATPVQYYPAFPDIDTYYFLRLSEYVSLHNGQLPAIDTYRNWPHGDKQLDYRLPMYLPAYLFMVVNALFPMTYLLFAFYFPVIMGAAAIFISYFLGRWLFQDRLAGLLGAFFAGVVPAFITRTSAAIIDKEATSAPFMFAALALFSLAYRTKKWTHGIAAAVCYGLFAMSWGGFSFFHLLLSVFAVALLLFHKDQDRLLVAFVPAIIVTSIGQLIFVPFSFSLVSPTTIVPLLTTALIVAMYAIRRFSILPPQQTKWIVPGLLVLGLLALAVGPILSDEIAGLVSNIVKLLTFEGTRSTTVAESIGGDWSALVVQTDIGPALGSYPFLASVVPVFSVWLLSIFGFALLFWKMNTGRKIAVPALILGLIGLALITIQSSATVRSEMVLAGLGLIGIGVLLSLYKSRQGDHLMLFPMLWFILGIVGVYFGIRLVYVAGPIMGMLAGFALSFGIRRLLQYRTLKDPVWTSLSFAIAALAFIVTGIVWWQQLFFPAITSFAIGAILLLLALYSRLGATQQGGLHKIRMFIFRKHTHRPLDILAIPLVIYLTFMVGADIAGADAYGHALGPSVNQPFNEAMTFLREQTPQNSSVISWWDFGYWFQTLGRRPTIADGGGAGAVSRYDLALWFTAPAENWTDHEPWLKEKLHVDYILMDYTLPGKYGAITKIASNGQQISGFLQFNPQPTNQFEQDNVTIIEFSANPYAIWVPVVGNQVVRAPLLLITQDGKVLNSLPINDLCTASGIQVLGDQQPSAGGCLALTSMGIFYLPPETEHTIFSRLMFMDGAGFPIEKVFDNQLIKIYKVPYGEEDIEVLSEDIAP